MDKPCIAKGCAAEGRFGLGSVLKGQVRWACDEHRALLEPKAKALPESEPPGPTRGSPPDLFSHAR